MKKGAKFRIDSLKVKSFVTDLQDDEERRVRGGATIFCTTLVYPCDCDTRTDCIISINPTECPGCN